MILSGFLKITRPTRVVSSAAPTDFGGYEVIRRNQGGGALVSDGDKNLVTARFGDIKSIPDPEFLRFEFGVIHGLEARLQILHLEDFNVCSGLGGDHREV